MSEVLVIGHRNPDTGAICSAIGYAEFKRLTGMPEALPARDDLYNALYNASGLLTTPHFFPS